MFVRSVNFPDKQTLWIRIWTYCNSNNLNINIKTHVWIKTKLWYDVEQHVFTLYAKWLNISIERELIKYFAQ